MNRLTGIGATCFLATCLLSLAACGGSDSKKDDIKANIKGDAKDDGTQTKDVSVTIPETNGVFWLYPAPPPRDGADLEEWRKSGEELTAGWQGKVSKSQYLRFGGDRDVRDSDLAKIGDLIALQTLDLFGCREITDAGLAHLKGLNALQTLDLGGCDKITDAGLAHLKGLTALQTLDLRWCDKITDAGLAHLKGLNALQTLYLLGCREITDAGLAHLKGLTTLQALYTRECDKITFVGVEALNKDLPALTVYR